jgi:trehalose-6-phosphate hydrolase
MSAGFRDGITVEAQQKDGDSILTFYKKLIAMRKTYPIIAKGEIAFLETENDMVMAYKRVLGDQQIVVLCNLDGKRQRIRTDAKWRGLTVLLENGSRADEENPSRADAAPGRASDHKGRVIFSGEGSYTMEPYELLVLGNMHLQES